MVCIYIRLPHYIISWLRNRDEKSPKPVGEPFSIEMSDPLRYYINDFAVPNLGGTVSLGCFSQQQWMTMLHGKPICAPGEAEPILKRDARTPLSMSEILRLSGNGQYIKFGEDGEPLPDDSYVMQYAAFKMPRTVTRDGREIKVQSDWYLPNISIVVTELRQRFVAAITRFIGVHMKDGRALQLPRSKMEAIDLFLLRYDIRTGVREREQMKKLVNRSFLSSAYSFEMDTVHASIREEELLERRRLAAKTRSREVICLDTGVSYPSMSAFARAYGVRSVIEVSKAIERGGRCHGVRVAFV